MADSRIVPSLLIVAGLGNPGREYEATRHNAGFLFLDFLAEEAQRSGAGVVWKEKLGAKVAEFVWGGPKIVAVKPQSYMNLSGEPLQRVMGFYKAPVADLVVVHDEIDLPLGSLRIKSGGGDGGHNGVSSVSQMLGTNDFVRFRIGIGRPDSGPDAVRSEGAVSNWVLGRFGADEKKALKPVFENAIQALEVFCSAGLQAAQNRFNR